MPAPVPGAIVIFRPLRLLLIALLTLLVALPLAVRSAVPAPQPTTLEIR